MGEVGMLQDINISSTFTQTTTSLPSVTHSCFNHRYTTIIHHININLIHSSVVVQVMFIYILVYIIILMN